MKKFIAGVILVVSMTGCQSFGSDFIEGAEERIRLKWAEEWKPALEAEMAAELEAAKDSVLSATASQIELQEEKTRARLASVNIRIEDYDRDKDGKVTGTESAEFLAAMKAARDKDGNPLGWLEMLMAVVLGYGTTTAGKEWVKSKMTKGTGDGTQPA